MTKHFTFFESYYEAVKDLDAEIKAEYFDILFQYSLHDEQPPETTTPIVKALFIAIKPNLDKSKARREAGKSGGKQTASKNKQTASKNKQTASDKEKDKDKDKDKEFTFSLPTKRGFDKLDDVYIDNLKKYISESKYSLTFEDFSESCLAKDYKYKNFSLAYNTWGKKDFNNSPKDDEEQEWMKYARRA